MVVLLVLFVCFFFNTVRWEEQFEIFKQKHHLVYELLNAQREEEARSRHCIWGHTK